MKGCNENFENVIFKDVFEDEDFFKRFIHFVGGIVGKKVHTLEILDSSYMEEEKEAFSIHMILNVDGYALWLIFVFGEKRTYFEEVYYYQTDEGRKLNAAAPVIRYNMSKISQCRRKHNKALMEKYDFILEMFDKLIDIEEKKLRQEGNA